MKKSIMILLLSVISSNVFSQEYQWSIYNIKVDRVNVNQVVSILDGYLSNSDNLAEGVTVSLYEIMFANNDVKATHIIAFSGSPDAMNSQYATVQTDEWHLMMSRLGQLTENDGSAAGRSIHTINSEVEGPIHHIVMLDVDEPSKKADAFKKMWTTVKPTSRITLGQVVSGRQNGGSHYVLVTNKDFKDLVSPRDWSAKEEAAWAKYRADGGATEVVSTQTRALVKQWK